MPLGSRIFSAKLSTVVTIEPSGILCKKTLSSLRPYRAKPRPHHCCPSFCEKLSKNEKSTKIMKKHENAKKITKNTKKIASPTLLRQIIQP